jgi:hypothetical protein
MTEFPRDFFKTDPVMSKLHERIKSQHKIADHTEKVLLENQHIPNFCEEATHFFEWPGPKGSLCVSYDVTSSLKPDGLGFRIAVTIDSITVYDSALELKTAMLNGKYAKKYTEHQLKGPLPPGLNKPS